MKSVIDLDSIKSQFDEECIQIIMKKEYPEHVGMEKYAIITALTQDEFREKYSVLYPITSEYVLMTLLQGEPILESDRNNAKHEKIQQRRGVSVEYDEALHTSSVQVSDVSEEYEKSETNIELHRCIAKLCPSQQRRIRKYFFDEKTIPQIADEEGVSHQTVTASLERARTALRKMLEHNYLEVFE